MTSAEPTAESAHLEEDEDDALKTLKYHLLGPSLTKAGQDKVDQSKVIAKGFYCLELDPHMLTGRRRFQRLFIMHPRGPSILAAKNSETRSLRKRLTKSYRARRSWNNKT